MRLVVEAEAASHHCSLVVRMDDFYWKLWSRKVIGKGWEAIYQSNDKIGNRDITPDTDYFLTPAMAIEDGIEKLAINTKVDYAFLYSIFQCAKQDNPHVDTEKDAGG